MSKVVIDMSMSLDGFVAGPDDGKAHPLGRTWWAAASGCCRRCRMASSPKVSPA
jgi:hypothetical protein